MKTKLLLLNLFAGLSLTAQTVAIPDTNFEQVLINKGIDSDGIINGLLLSSDAESVTELNIEGPEFYEAQIADLTGLEAFINLENFQISFTQITSLDISHNTKLKVLTTYGNYLTSLDVSSNILLEVLNVDNVSDLGPHNEITVLDLSNNPNIRIVGGESMFSLERINLRNGANNENMTIQIGFFPMGNPDEIINSVCIEVDDAELALSNQYPYSEWTIYHFGAQYNFSENCALSTESPVAYNNIFVYPNPVSNTLYIQNQNTPANGQLFDISGRLVREYKNVGTQGMDVSALAKGIYVVKISDGKSVKSQKVIVE